MDYILSNRARADAAEMYSSQLGRSIGSLVDGIALDRPRLVSSRLDLDARSGEVG